MPLAAGVACVFGCPHVVTRANPCPTHTRHANKEATRSDATKERDKLYRTQQWRRFRAWFLSTDCETAGCSHHAAHALCQDCWANGQLVTVATDVDHVVPRAEGGADYDPKNCRGLCRSCHSRRTRADQYSGGRTRGAA